MVHARFWVDDGLCGSYPTKPDRTITSGLPTIQKLSLGLSDVSSKRLSTASQCALLLGVCGIRGPLFQHRLREGCWWQGVRAREPTNNQGILRYNGRRR